MKFSVYIATSLDGFIARPDGSLDWLPQAAPDGEDCGYQAFSDSIDTVLMGRGTYEKVLTFGDWPYKTKRTVVLSSGQATIRNDLKPLIESSSLAPCALADYLEATGSKSVYVDGGKTIQSFLHAGLISEITLTVIPVLIGAGLPLFGPLSADVHLDLASSRSFANGMVQSTYVVRR
ncbi:MAG: dihydrofolate reductase family protein [Candidatus Roseilinea sp.]|nr:dihydrofolate reductase family protein [Candidatus Roseilinea sp.]